MSNAILPKNKIQRSLKELKIGESGWIVPWAVFIDKNRHMWLDPTQTARPRQTGTITAEAIKISEDEYKIVFHEDHHWTPSKDVFPEGRFAKVIEATFPE